MRSFKSRRISRCIELLRNGFMLEDVFVKPNERIATIEVLQATLGLRLGDILKLKLSSFIRDGDRWRLDIREEKTKKNEDIYSAKRGI